MPLSHSLESFILRNCGAFYLLFFLTYLSVFNKRLKEPRFDTTEEKHYSRINQDLPFFQNYML